jgi:hypothetical protein
MKSKREKIELRWGVRDSYGLLWSAHALKSNAEREAALYPENRVVRLRKKLREA